LDLLMNFDSSDWVGSELKIMDEKQFILSS